MARSTSRLHSNGPGGSSIWSRATCGRGKGMIGPGGTRSRLPPRRIRHRAPRSLRHCEVLVGSGGMPTCPHCQQIIVTRDGHDRHGRQRFTCGSCGRDFTVRSASVFSGYRWPADVILMAVRWYLRHPLSATSVMELLAERGIDVSNRTVLRWVQAFGPQLAAEARKHRRPLGRRWYTDEMFFFRAGHIRWPELLPTFSASASRQDHMRTRPSPYLCWAC